MRIDVSQETIDVSGVIGRKRNDVGLYATLLAGAAIVLYLTYDILLTNIFGLYYCKIAPPHPKTKIEKKVAYPISIYWEDNVYPGFSKQDRELMIKNYLDGVHLKTMALSSCFFCLHPQWERWERGKPINNITFKKEEVA